MDSHVRKRPLDPAVEVNLGEGSKRPWTSPKVILSDPMSSARVDNKGITTGPDIKLSSTSTS
jgi:hypothetical protein